MLYTMHPITKWSELRLWSKVALLPLIQLHLDRYPFYIEYIILCLYCYVKWYEAHYAKGLGRKKNAKLTEEENKVINGEKSASVQKKIDARAKNADVATALSEQFGQGRLLARISSRPGQQGRCDGYILEGKELDFYVRKLKVKKSK